MKTRSLVLAFVSFLLWQKPALAAGDEWQNMGWEKVNAEDGITVFRKSFPNSAVKGVGGEALVDASIGRILWVLMDNDHKGDWVDKFKSTKTLETPNDMSNIQYAAFSMPFPVTNRDFVYRYDFSVDPSINAVIVDVKSVEHPKAPVADSIGVRGTLVHGRYILSPKGPNQTFVKAEYLADPKGILPSWVVNIVQKNWPYKTLMGLRKQVKKPFVQEWDVYTKLLEPKMKLAH